jgi:hypothetical protein
MLYANEVNATKDIGEPLVLPEERKLVDGGDNDGWYESVNVLIGHIHGQPLPSTRTGGTLASVLDKAQLSSVRR